MYHKYDQSANLLVPANVSYTSIDELLNSNETLGIGIAGQVFKLKEPLSHYKCTRTSVVLKNRDSELTSSHCLRFLLDEPGA